MKRFLLACVMFIASWASSGAFATPELASFSSPPKFLVYIWNGKAGGIGIGTGIVVRDHDRTFAIITNDHVVRGAEKVWVRFPGSRNQGVVLELAVKSRDPVADLALLASPDTMPLGVESIPWADMSKVRIGDRVVAVGYPYGVYLVTHGTIAGLTAPQTIPVFLTHQAPINPGNSGGALVGFARSGAGPEDDVLVGINTQVATRVHYGKERAVQTIASVGYSIRSDDAERILARMRSVALVKHASAGWALERVSDAPPPIFVSAGLPYPPSVPVGPAIAVVAVASGSPAALADIRPGDIIVSAAPLSSSALADAGTFARAIFHDMLPGGKLRIELLRGSARLLRDVTLGEHEAPPSE